MLLCCSAGNPTGQLVWVPVGTVAKHDNKPCQRKQLISTPIPLNRSHTPHGKGVVLVTVHTRKFKLEMFIAVLAEICPALHILLAYLYLGVHPLVIFFASFVPAFVTDLSLLTTRKDLCL